MTKKNLIDLADAIRVFGENISLPADKISIPVSVLADFCATQNPNFDRNRWLDYIAGNCGKNGGKVACDAKRECLNACREYVSKNRAVNG